METLSDPDIYRMGHEYIWTDNCPNVPATNNLLDQLCIISAQAEVCSVQFSLEALTLSTALKPNCKSLLVRRFSQICYSTSRIRRSRECYRSVTQNIIYINIRIPDYQKNEIFSYASGTIPYVIAKLNNNSR